MQLMWQLLARQVCCCVSLWIVTLVEPSKVILPMVMLVAQVAVCLCAALDSSNDSDISMAMVNRQTQMAQPNYSEMKLMTRMKRKNRCIDCRQTSDVHCHLESFEMLMEWFTASRGLWSDGKPLGDSQVTRLHGRKLLNEQRKRERERQVVTSVWSVVEGDTRQVASRSDGSSFRVSLVMWRCLLLK